MHPLRRLGRQRGRQRIDAARLRPQGYKVTRCAARTAAQFNPQPDESGSCGVFSAESRISKSKFQKGLLMSEQLNVKAVRRIYQLTNDGDLTSVLKMMSDDLELFVFGSAKVPWAGHWRGGRVPSNSL